MQCTQWGVDKLAEHAMTIGFRPEHGVGKPVNVAGFDDYRDFPNITRGLVKRGYSDEQIKGILGENFLRVFEQVCG
jgi:membrane dipeptidase